MHWLTFIFGFLAIYCAVAFGYTLFQGDIANSHGALWFWGIGALIFALASPLNQLRHARRRRNQS